MTQENSKAKRNMIYADMSLLLVALSWGGGFVAVKDALDNMTPLFITAIRFALAAIIMGLIYINRLKQVKKKDIYNGIIVGTLLFLAFTTQTVGLQYTEAGKQAFLTGTNVVIVPFLAWMIHRKRPDGYAIGATILAFIGIALLTLQGNGFNMNKGDVLTLLCAFFFASHIVSVGYFAKDSDPYILATLQIAVTAVIGTVVALIFEPMPEALLSKNTFGPIAYLVLASTVMAFLIQNVAQTYTTSTHAALILSLEAVFGVIMAVIFLKEALTTKMLIGCVLIFIAIVMAETKLSFLKLKKTVVDENE